MDKDPFRQKNPENGYTDAMRTFVADYAYDISGFFLHYDINGLNSVKELLKEHKIRTFTEYLATTDHENPMISESDMENPILKQKISRLEELGREMRDTQSLTDEKFLQIKAEVKQITSSKE